MKHMHSPTVAGTAAPRRAVDLRALASLLAVLAAALGAGCDMGTPQGQIPGVTQAAPKLEEYDDRGNYTPYYATAEMITPRYLHEGLLGTNGLVYIFGGSDERGLASLDSVEIYDQSTYARDAIQPDSGAGLWVDTNYEGDPISMKSGSRILMTVNELSNNKLVMIGGSSNLLQATLYGKVEVFNPDTRDFQVLEQEMQNPRFRHSTVQLASGDLMIAGGQIESSITVVSEQQPGQGQGNVPNQQNVTVFPSTETVVIFSTKDLSFSSLLPYNSNTPVTLQTQRGRAGHTMTRIAGPDNRLNNSDDLWVLLGGFQTLSAASGQAPQSKEPGAIGRGEADGLTTIEIFDPQTNLFTLIASAKLGATRVHFPEAVNLGKYNDYTPDGIIGMGNAILITGGNDDAGDQPTTAVPDQLFIAYYTAGAGPAQGLRFFEVEEDAYFSYIQNNEYQANLAAIARCATNTVSLPRPYETLPRNDGDRETWVFSLAGVDFAGGAADYDSPGMRAGQVFDPFFSLRAAFSGLAPTDLQNERRSNSLNTLGIVGVWMVLDGSVTMNIEDFGTSAISRFAQSRGERRVYHKCIQLAGVDGIRNTFDDRILLGGGGQNYGLNGGEPTSPSAEIFLPPGVGSIE